MISQDDSPTVPNEFDREADCLDLSEEDLADLKDQWTMKQLDLRSRLTDTDSSPKLASRQLSLVGGLDISFIVGEDRLACACYVVLDTQLKVVYSSTKMVTLTTPYLPGYLAFREAEPLVALVTRQMEEQPNFTPDALLVDGNGQLHPRLCGVACHIGLATGLPTVGVAKNLHQVDMLDQQFSRDQIKKRFQTEPSLTQLLLRTEVGEVLGAAVTSAGREGGGRNPVFVSVGSGVSLETAVWLVTTTSRFKVPEPTRQADFLSREFLRTNHPTPRQVQESKQERCEGGHEDQNS